MAQGKNNAAIAATLTVSERAVEKHTNSIFLKLGLSEEKDVNRRVKAVLLFLSRARSRAGRLAAPRRRKPAPCWPGRAACEAERVNSPHSVLVVDDQAPFRMAVKAVLRRLAGFELAAEASDGLRRSGWSTSCTRRWC